MLKCPNCQLVFHSDYLLRCPSCNGILTQASVVEAQGAVRAKFQGSVGLGKLIHFVGSYFQAKSFTFYYALSRCELKIGRGYSRFFVYPPDWGFLVRLPWLMVNIVDSLFFRLIYKGFCEKCGWKYPKVTGGLSHNADECDYHKEYTAILGSIVSGKISNEAEAFRRQSEEKCRNGKKSAWQDLSHRNTSFELSVDIVSLLFSFGLFIYGIVRLAMPIFGLIYDFEY